MYKLLKLTDMEQWLDSISKLPLEQQDVYFTPEYYKLYELNGDGEARCFVFEKDGDIAIYPFLLNSINKLGYDLDKEYYDIQGAYGYNGVLSSSYDESFINEFWKSFEVYCQQNNIVAEFMRFHPLMGNYKFGENYFKTIFDRHTVYLDLQKTKEDIFAGFKSSTRKHIKKASLSIEIRRALYSKENITIFNNIYVENMKKVNSIPYLFFSKSHFENLFRLKDVEFFIAYMDDKPIACYSGLISNQYYGNYLRASLTEYNKTGVNTLMYWSMIQSAKEHGCKFVHFGGGTSNELDNSLLQYKMNFSQTLSDFYIGKKIHNEDIYNEIVNQWKSKYHDNYEKNKQMLLGYREI